MTASTTTSASARRWGWAILLLTSSISLAFNLGHAVLGPAGSATHSVPKPLVVLYGLYGVAPVLVAMMLSHLIAIQHGGWAKRTGTGLVFVSAMALSVKAIYEVLQPIAGHWGLLFAAMLDLSSLLALNEILDTAPTATATTPATSHSGSGGPADRHSQAPATSTATATATRSATTPAEPATTTATSDRHGTATTPPRSRTGGAAASPHHIAAGQRSTSTRSHDLARKNSDDVPGAPAHRRRESAPTGQGALDTARGTSGDTTSGSLALAALPTTATKPATRSATGTQDTPATPVRHTATSKETATTDTATGTATTGRHNVLRLRADWRDLLADDIAAAATEFVRDRDEAGQPRRGAGTEFAELAQQQGVGLSKRQLRDYVTKASKQIDQDADQQTA